MTNNQSRYDSLDLVQEGARARARQHRQNAAVGAAGAVLAAAHVWAFLYLYATTGHGRTWAVAAVIAGALGIWFAVTAAAHLGSARADTHLAAVAAAVTVPPATGHNA